MPNRLPADSSKKTIRRALLAKNRSQRPRPRFVKDLQLLGYERIVGVDEVGRGALAGPLVVAAVEIYQPINGINDSKLLTRAKRELLSDLISQSAKQVRFGQASNLEIDELGLAAAQRLAYERCLDGMSFDLALTDFYALKGIKHLKAIKGDQLFYPVAAASIVAKVHRDQLMSVYHQAHPDYLWADNAGYGTRAHKKALGSIGPSPLHRQSFLH
ncbi:MAG: ribonuclease HII [bacterium]|nr:ribonuclease HII [bacterium]